MQRVYVCVYFLSPSLSFPVSLSLRQGPSLLQALVSSSVRWDGYRVGKTSDAWHTVGVQPMFPEWILRDELSFCAFFHDS